MNKPLTCVHKDAWWDGTRPSCGETISLSNDTVKKSKGEQLILKRTQKQNYTETKPCSFVFSYAIPTPEARLGMLQLLRSVYMVVLLFIPLGAPASSPSSNPIGQPACARHHGRSVAILCKLTPVNHFTNI